MLGAAAMRFVPKYRRWFVGSPRPGWHSTMPRWPMLLIDDSRAAVPKESEGVILSKAAICAEIDEILAGTASVPARSTTIFKSVGIAVEDIAAPMLVYDIARTH
jgi:hypothetical protein